MLLTRSVDLESLQKELSRNHRRRAIPWDTFRRAEHDPRHLERVGRAWLWRAKQEHLAVSAFARLTLSLAKHGADPVVLGLAARASADEVRHTALCAAWARHLLGSEEVIASRMQGLAPRFPLADQDRKLKVLAEAVEMCCFSETLTSVYFTEMLPRAAHPVARALIECLLEDEVDHGRLGWAYLAQRAAEGNTEGLAALLPRIVDRTVGAVVRDAEQAPEVDEVGAETLGHLGLTTSASLYCRALYDTIIVGLEAVGIDTSHLRVHAESRDYRALAEASRPAA